MTREEQLTAAIARIIAADSTYHREAYEFIYAAVISICNAPDAKGGHIAAQELLLGIRGYALAQFAGFTEAVFNTWGIHRAADIGKIVFKLAGEKILSVSESDHPSDFEMEFDLFSLSRAAGQAPTNPARANTIIV